MARHAKYDDNRRVAEIFQDWVGDELHMRGISYVAYCSQEYQYFRGENSAGIEIKLDRKFRQTGNICIEMAEKHSEDSEFKPSGIYRADNTIDLVVGDFGKFWKFSVEWLRWIWSCERNREIFSLEYMEITTAKGYLMPVRIADLFGTKFKAKAIPPTFNGEVLPGVGVDTDISHEDEYPKQMPIKVAA